MIKELIYVTVVNVNSVDIGSTMVDDFDAALKLATEKIKLNSAEKAFLYSCIVNMDEELSRRKKSEKYDCFYWKTRKEITLSDSEKFEVTLKNDLPEYIRIN